MKLNNSNLSDCTGYSSQQPQVFFYVSTIDEVITGPDLSCQLLLHMSDAFVLMSSGMCQRLQHETKIDAFCNSVTLKSARNEVSNELIQTHLHGSFRGRISTQNSVYQKCNGPQLLLGLCFSSWDAHILLVSELVSNAI